MKKKTPLPRRDCGCDWIWRARTSWEFAREMFACQRHVGLPFGPNTRPRFWGADANITPLRALLLCISHPDSAAEAGEGRRTKAQPHLVSFLTLSACYTLCQAIFTPSKFEAVWCAVKNTIKLNYSGTRSFPPPHSSSFPHLILEQRKITQRSIRKGKNQKTSTAGVLEGTASPWVLRPPAKFPHFPQPISLELCPLCPQCQVISNKTICSGIAAVCCRPAPGEAVPRGRFPSGWFCRCALRAPPPHAACQGTQLQR